MAKKGQKSSLRDVFKSVREDARTWPWWMNNAENEKLWEELPEDISTALKVYLPCELFYPRWRLPEHIKECKNCRMAIVDLIEGLQYLRYLVEK